MSKSNARKITVEATKCNSDSRRPSVFERLGTKPAPSSVPQSASTEYCRNWALNGNCSYGKNCKYASTHTLISPSKRAKKDNVTGNPTTVVPDDPFKRLTSKIVKKASHSPDLNLEEWNQTDLEYEDEKVLERRRQLLQRELELQMKKDKEVHGKDKGSNKHKKKAMSSSSSSRTSSSSSSSSSTSSSDDSSSSTTSDSRNKKPKKIKNKRHYGGSGAGGSGGGGAAGGGGPSEYDEEKERRKKIKLKRLGVKPDKNSVKKKRKLDANVVIGKKSDSGKTSSSTKKSSSSTAGTGTVTGSGSGTVAASSSSSSSLTRSKYHPTSSSSSSGRGTSGVVTGGKSPSTATLTPPLTKSKDRTRSESPKGKSSSSRDDKDRRSKKSEEKGADSGHKSTSTSASRNLDRSKDTSDTGRSRRDEKSSSSKSNSTYGNDKKPTTSTSTSSSREKDRRSSRTPPAPPPPAPPSSKSSSKARRSSRTPEKSNSNSSSASSSSRSKREASPRRLEARKRERSSRERDERRHESSSRKSLQDERSSSSSRRSKERAKDKRTTTTATTSMTTAATSSSSSSLRSRDRGSKTRDVVSSCFGSDKSSRSRDKERDGPGAGGGGGGKEEKLSRDRRNDRYEKSSKTTSSTSQSASASSSRFDSRYEKSSSSPLTSSSSSNLHKSGGSGSERFQASHERLTLEKIGGSSSNDAGIYERERSHRRYERKEPSSSGGGSGGTGGSGIQPLPPPPPPPPQSSSSSSNLKIDRRMDAISSSSSPRRSLEMDRSFGDRGYGRIEHWPEEREEHLEFRDHPSRHDRKGLSEGRGGYSSPFDRGSERRPPQRYSVQGGERQFEEHPSHHRHHHHHHHHHSSSSSSSVYPGDKIRGGSSAGGGGSGSGGGGGGTGSREESGENWDGHREHIEHQPPLPPHPSSHPPRDRNYGKPNSSDWEDRSEWRSRTVWERENLQRPEAPHEEEWGGPPPRYDSPLPEWKVSESRNWESSQSFRGNYRNERPKDLEDVNHGKRRGYGNTPEIREECLPHVSKQAAIYGSMKDEPINKKLMELAEGRLRKSREKSVDSFHKKQPQPPPPVPVAVIPREKSVERKEIEQPASLPAVNPPKRPCVEESVPITPALHTESDLSDISDDPDDILNMEDEEMEAKPVGKVQEEEQREAVPAAPIPQELAQNSPKEPPDEPIFPKERDEATISGAFSGSRSIEDENMETMDFEEISDGELEEDIKTSGKGLGDALGVDWESLVKESRPRKSMNTNQNVKSRWQCKAIFQRIGISTKNAGDELVAKLVGKTESDSGFVLLDGVALMHSALTRKKSQESRNFSFTEFGHRESIDEEESENEVSLGDTSSLYNEAKLLLQQSV